LRIVFSDVHKRADPPPPRGLLRVRSKRPPGRRSAEKFNELAPSHPPAPKAKPVSFYLFLLARWKGAWAQVDARLGSLADILRQGVMSNLVALDMPK
jgi:hypothetical protein